MAHAQTQQTANKALASSSAAVIDLTGPDHTPMADAYGIPEDSDWHREVFEWFGDHTSPFEAVSPRDPSSVAGTRSPSPEVHRFLLPEVNLLERPPECSPQTQWWVNQMRIQEEAEQSLIRQDINDTEEFPTDPSRYSPLKNKNGANRWLRQRIKFRCLETVADGVPPAPRWTCYSSSSTGDGLKHPIAIRSARHAFGPAKDSWPEEKYSKPAPARTVQKKLEEMLAADPDNNEVLKRLHRTPKEIEKAAEKARKALGLSPSSSSAN
ncbi:hypothetical protein B0T19DRAFT_401643 [Cercophora scortea]|uniref:Uncharacterized protein n=1 Tax=Cercophora scortea TaxID=314031 RepID=A0AAE0IEI0_9PEZI|nr:hypothetical protein B0T19DRAFT_401643 [Cercophora scortea]